jgi:hypothetical protein
MGPQSSLIITVNVKVEDVARAMFNTQRSGIPFFELIPLMVKVRSEPRHTLQTRYKWQSLNCSRVIGKATAHALSFNSCPMRDVRQCLRAGQMLESIRILASIPVLANLQKLKSDWPGSCPANCNSFLFEGVAAIMGVASPGVFKLLG